MPPPNFFTKKSHLILIALIIFSLIPLLDLFHLGLPLTHDGKEHVQRIASYFLSLSDGNIIPRWAGNLNWGYGHPVFIFFYPLPYYLGSLFHYLGLTYINSTKIVFGLSYLLSGIFMYLWMKELFGEWAGYVSGLIYIYTPYRFVDIYVRGALGESLAFAWPPLVCYFFIKLTQKFEWRYITGASISMALLVLSHNALSLMFFIAIIGYVAYLIFISKTKITYAKNFFLSILIAFMISAFFWLPALMEAKYTLRDIVTNNSIEGFENICRLIWSNWSYGGSGSFSVQLGILQWFFILAAPIVIWIYKKKNEKIWILLSIMLGIFFISILMILPISKPLYLIIPLIKDFQFAWRFLSLAIFIPPIIAGATIALLKKNYIFTFVVLLTILCLSLNRYYWKANNFFIQDDWTYLGPQETSTNDTGESSPIWSIRRMEEFPKSSIEIIEGDAEIITNSRNSTEHIYNINAKTDSKILENTLYFPGWTITVDGKFIIPEFQNQQYRGLMTFNVTKGEHIVKIIFTETRLRLISDIISIIGLIVVFSMLVMDSYQRLRYYK